MRANQAECPKCCGKGNIPAFAGIAGGVCFKCAGAGVVNATRSKANRFAEINAMHCPTLAEAQAYRLSEFSRRFPELVDSLSADAESLYAVRNGCGKLRWVVERLTAGL